MRYRFCPSCASELSDKTVDGRIRKMCSNCGFVLYLNPTPAAAAVLIQDGEILLVRRKYPPKAGEWSLPAGFVEADESPEEAAVREVKEETGLNICVQDLHNVYGACHAHTFPIVLIVYIVDLLGGSLVAGDDAAEARFFSLDALPNEIAFSSHRQAIEQALQRVAI